MIRPGAALMLVVLWWPLESLAAGDTDIPLPELDAHDITRGEFTQIRQLPELTRPLRSSGRFVHDVDRGILWQVDEPAPSTLVITPGGLYRNGERQSGASPMTTLRPVFRALFSGDMARLQDHFEVTTKAVDVGWELELSPRDSSLADALASITLSGDAYPHKVMIKEGEGGRTELRFAAIEHPETLDEQTQQVFERVGKAAP